MTFSPSPLDVEVWKCVESVCLDLDVDLFCRNVVMTESRFPFTRPGRVQTRRRHLRGGPEERCADPSRFSHPCHRLQQESQRAEAQNIGLESVSAAGPVSPSHNNNIQMQKCKN